MVVNMKLLLRNARLPDGTAGHVTVEGERIFSVSAAEPEGKFDRILECRNRLLLPGLYNAHTHAAMQLFRGYGEDLPLQRWLNERIFPAEEKLTARAVYTASLFAAAEMIRNGLVSFSDMYYFSEETVRAVMESGMKANISRSIVSFDPEADFRKDSRYLEAVSLFEQYHGAADGRIKVDMSLHAEYTNVEGMCRTVAEYASSHNARIQVHVSETKKEHEECIERHGMTPIAFLAHCGVLDVPVSAAHCVWVDENDMAVMREKGVTAVHNPVSNLKLGSGIMPLGAMRDAGVTVALGTDSAASNNTLDIMKEMFVASILHKGVSYRPDLFEAASFLRMATENGALSQGRTDCGRLEAGMRADLILIDLDAVNNIPMYDPVYTAVYSANASNVCMTMADGKILWENGAYICIDMEKLKYEMREICENYF